MRWFLVLATNRYLRFVVDVAASAFLTWVLAVLAAKIAFTEFVAVLGLFGFPALFLGLMAGPFVVVPIIGFATFRFGLVLGPIMLAVIIHVASSSRLKQNEEAVAALTNATIEPARMDHRLLAIDQPRQGTDCDRACIRVVATSSHTLALRNESRGISNWIVYAQATGAACFAKENAKLALDFLTSGFPGKCATRETIDDFADGLLLRVSGPRRQPAPDLPKEFTGAVYESFERIDGHDRLLARHISGAMDRLSNSTFLVEKSPGLIEAGPPIDTFSFLANAIGSDVDTLRGMPPTPFPFDEVLDGIESYIDRNGAIDGETMRYARSAWSLVSTNAVTQQTELVKRHMLRMFATRDPARIELALGLAYLPLDARVFSDADDLMLDLLFVPVSDQATFLLKRLLDGQFAAGRSPPPSAELRDRAKAHLDDPDLKPWQQQLLKQIAGS